MPRLLISAAHTLENPGEIFGDLREADLTRKILKKTLPYLDNLNIEYQAVPLDLQLLKRLDWIKASGYSKDRGDIFIEIHVNDGGKRGIESWFEGAASPTNNSQKFSDAILNGICKYTGYQNQGSKSEYEHDLGSLLILNQSNMISTAVETLYIDNPEDIQILKDDSKLEDLAKAIADSVNDYLKNVAPTLNYSAQPASAPFAVNPMRSNPSFGGFSNSPTSNSPFNSPMPSISSPAQNKPVLMDRDERKEMIKKLYLKILGKEPNANDLNYHLNTGVTENELIKKLTESPEHEEMVKNAKEFKELSDKSLKLQSEIDQLKANQKDFKVMQETLNRLLEQKNALIIRLHQELTRNNIIVHGGHIDSIQAQVNPQQNFTNNAPKKKRTFTDFLMDIFRL